MHDEAKKNLVLAREAYAERDWEKADSLLREVLSEADAYADVHNMLGVIAHARGNLIAAEHHLERALAINPRYTEAALNLTVTYNDRGKYEKARVLHTQIREQSSTPSIEHFARGRIANMHAEVAQAYLDAQMPLDAVRELEKAVHLAPSFADLHTRLGGLLRELGDLQAARAHYEAAVTSRPGFAAAHLGLGVTLLAQGDAEGARVEWEKVRVLDPANTQAKMYLRTLTTPPAA